jgi:hypothetical protein
MRRRCFKGRSSFVTFLSIFLRDSSSLLGAMAE